METFLELFSEDNFDAFCLAYMFTYRDFEGGTLGLAWTGDLQNAGGVCEKNGVGPVRGDHSALYLLKEPRLRDCLGSPRKYYL